MSYNATQKQLSGVQPVFKTQVIYLKESIFKSLKAPGVFKNKPEYGIKFEIGVTFERLKNNEHEVCLRLAVGAFPKGDTENQIFSEEDCVYQAEIKQAGIFTLKDFDETQNRHIKQSVCPEILFPFARERLLSNILQAGFPPIYLEPINFAAVASSAVDQKEALLKTKAHSV
jgi:preprotein translocase subunit SecB